MNKEAALQNYTSAMGALNEHQKENRAVFEAHQRLVLSVMRAENALRDAVAEAKEGVTNGLYTATYTPTTQTVYDEEKIRSALSSNPAILADAIKVIERPAKITVSAARI